MTTTADAPSRSSIQAAEYVNPLLSATKSVFEMMIGCTPVRTGLWLKQPNSPENQLSAVIGITGRITGTIVVGMSGSTACNLLERMVGTQTKTVDREVCDAVGELTNMIAGAAKAQLAKYELSLSIPNVVTGSNCVVHFPSDVHPMVIGFDTDAGPLSIEVGFCGLAQD